jgi:hypothetical protein
MAILNAVNTIYPSADTCGCFFHFCQCIYRKVQDCGLQAEYSQVDFNMFIRTMAALAFVPVGSVIDSYETLLETHAPVSATSNRRNVRRQPLFGLDVWNVYNRVDESLPRTNNSVEAWHRGFQSSLSSSRPSLWKLTEQLKKEEGLLATFLHRSIYERSICT